MQDKAAKPPRTWTAMSFATRIARIDSRESIRQKAYFHNVRAILVNRQKSLQFALPVFSAPKRDLQQGIQFGNPADRFARIGPSKTLKLEKAEER